MTLRNGESAGNWKKRHQRLWRSFGPVVRIRSEWMCQPYAVRVIVMRWLTDSVVRVPGVNTRDCMVWLHTGNYSGDIAGCTGGLWTAAAVVCWSHAAFLWRCAPDVTAYLMPFISSPIVMLILCLFSDALWAAQVTVPGNAVMNSELQRLWKEADVPEFT